MLRTTFDNDIQELREQTLMLASEVEKNLIAATNALCSRDFETSRRIIRVDEWINEKRIEIGMSSLRLMATQQPMAGDMRQIAAIIEIVGELERIHDYAKGIGKVNLLILGTTDIAPLVSQLPTMAQKAADMLNQSIKAFALADAQLARAIPPLDDQVDDLYNQLNENAIQYVMADPAQMEIANRIQWSGHNLERSADRVINICEWIIYMVSGEYEELDVKLDAIV